MQIHNGFFKDWYIYISFSHSSGEWPQIPAVFFKQGVWLNRSDSQALGSRTTEVTTQTGGSAVMKARRDVPPYLSWVFLLQTLLQCVKDRSKTPFLQFFPPPPLFPSFLTGFLDLTLLFFVRMLLKVTQTHTVRALTDRYNLQMAISCCVLTP